MTSLRITLVISCIGVTLCLSQRSHRFPRSDCEGELCVPEHSEATGAQWDTPKDPAEQFSKPVHYPFSCPMQYAKRLVDSFSASSQPSYVSLRTKRSITPEDHNNMKVIVVPIENLAEGLKVPQSQIELETTPLDKRLEEIVTRAILSARSQAEAQSAFYWHGAHQHPFHNIKMGNHGMGNEEYIYEDLEQAYAMPPNVTMEQQMVKEEFSPVVNQRVTDPEKFNSVKIIGDGGAKGDRMVDAQKEKTEAQVERRTHPTIMENIQAPAYEVYAREAPETAIPAP
ncbi:uncharacterized protein LOC107042690 [Diachasma alloeum]|uniref:uncharacterized protein LOC107042690 n=1 Tax=Diachasma alloeum TaxID=454923 RepID=UPI0007384706|nr:uncharacterized protein LOC107042690 [Diachasma alloeum]